MLFAMELNKKSSCTSKNVNQLTELKLITLYKIGKENFFIDTAIYDYSQNAPQKLKSKSLNFVDTLELLC